MYLESPCTHLPKNSDPSLLRAVIKRHLVMAHTVHSVLLSIFKDQGPPDSTLSSCGPSFRCHGFLSHVFDKKNCFFFGKKFYLENLNDRKHFFSSNYPLHQSKLPQMSDRLVSAQIAIWPFDHFVITFKHTLVLSLIHIWRCRRLLTCRSRWSPYH